MHLTPMHPSSPYEKANSAGPEVHTEPPMHLAPSLPNTRCPNPPTTKRTRQQRDLRHRLAGPKRRSSGTKNASHEDDAN
jgi:hypothetical protein